jgi:hypothetical protein
VAGTAVVGAILVVAGIVFLIGQLVDIRLGVETWPFYIIGAGVILAAFGLSQPGNSGLTVAGSIVTVVGALLFYQEWADHYESWAYAWALVAPGGSGLGMLLHGTRHGNPKMARDGTWQIVTALGIFAVGFVFFEGIIGLSGDRWNLPEWVLPASIIVIGVALLFRAVTSGREGRPA